MLADIQKQTDVVAAAKAEARSSGGLVQAMALTRAETEKLALAQLKLAWYQAQYGIGTPQLAASQPPAVKDDITKKDSLDADTTAPVWADPDNPDIDYSSGLFSGIAEEGFVMAGWYGVLETRAEIDNSPKVLAINFSDYNPEAFQDKRRLLLQCNEGTLSIVYDVDSFMAYNYRSDTVRVTYRIDAADAVNVSWSKVTSNQGTGVFGNAGSALMLDLMKNRKLFLRTYDNNGKTFDASFDMKGTAKAVEAVAAACGFSTLDLSKDDLKSIQALLNNAGFNAGTPDGAWGSGSKLAMRAFEETKGLRVTGALDEASLRALGISF